jgi:hypothetical protein
MESTLSSQPTRGVFPCLSRLALAAGAALVAASCATTKVQHFQADPHDICLGTQVTVRWSVQGGTASVRADPPLTPKSGRTYVPPASMKFILTLKPFLRKPISKETPVKVFTGTASAPQPDRIAFEPKCELGGVVQQIDRPFSQWDQKLIVGTLESGGTRDIAVEHEGRQATLTSQTPKTEVFDGTKLGGPWKISAPLLPAESCDGAGQKPPRVLILTAQVHCAS